MICFVLVGALGAGCAPSTQMTGVWSAPGYTGAPSGKVLVIGIGAKEMSIRMFEDAMAAQLAKRKMTVTKGYSVFPVNVPIDSMALRQYVKDNMIDLLTVTRLVDVSSETYWVQGGTTYVPMASYYNYGGYYSSAYATVYEPSYQVTTEKASVETNVFAASTEGLVWSGHSEIVDPSYIPTAINEISILLVAEMATSGVFGRK
jgi:hypothetical protein